MEKRSYKLRGTPDCPITVYGVSKPTTFSHWHPEVQVLMVQEGTLHCRLEDRELMLSAGDILVINPNQYHCTLHQSEDHRHIGMTFSLEVIAMPEIHVFQRNFVAPLADGRLQLPNLLQPGHPAYESVANAMNGLSGGNLYLEETKLLRYYRVMTICMALQPYCKLTQAEDQRQAPEDRTVRKAMVYIHNYHRTSLTLVRIARHVHLDPTYLCKVFKKQTGHTVMEHLAITRVDAAKFLLRRDALPMARIAELAGFPSERAFYRQFKQITGITPKTYQKQQLMQDDN